MYQSLRRRRNLNNRYYNNKFYKSNTDLDYMSEKTLMAKTLKD